MYKQRVMYKNKIFLLDIKTSIIIIYNSKI